MTIRKKITEYISTVDDVNAQATLVANRILDIIDDEGLELDEFREVTGIEKWAEAKVIRYASLKAKPDCLAIAILYMLEDQGLSLTGNGWLDNDDLTVKIIDEIYDAVDGNIKTTDLQDAYSIARR
jgi:hypothetical protein